MKRSVRPADKSKTEVLKNTVLVSGGQGSANVFEEAVERLGRSIKLGLVEPGEQLPPERNLATLMGISRTTVRSAIKVLAEGGFLVSRRGRGGGTFVADDPPKWLSSDLEGESKWNEESASFYLDRRFIIECGIVELACQRADSDEVGSLREIVGEMSELLDDFELFRAKDVKFHIAIAQATDNIELVRMMADIQSELGELLAFLPPNKDALLHSNQQHAEIVAAIAKGDEVKGRAAMQGHVSGTRLFLKGLLPN